MPTHIALLRGINVGGHNMVAMADLRAMLGELGFADAATLLQSGNAVFKSERLSGEGLEKHLEKETAQRLGVEADYVVRTDTELRRVIARNPFPKEAKSDPGHMIVMFLKSAAAAKSVATLRAAIKGPEVVHGDGRHLYLVYPDGMGRSKFTGALIERTLGARGTARNWNTVLKLAAMCG